jgi:hypothetical protein
MTVTYRRIGQARRRKLIRWHCGGCGWNGLRGPACAQCPRCGCATKPDGTPWPVAIGTEDRLEITLTAAVITSDPSDAAAVAGHARALLAWAEAARDQDDCRVRLRSLRQHKWNCLESARRNRPGLDDPAEFLRGVIVLYDFATGGTPQ